MSTQPVETVENLAARLYLADPGRRGEKPCAFIAQTPEVQHRYRVMAQVARDGCRREAQVISPPGASS